MGNMQDWAVYRDAMQARIGEFAAGTSVGAALVYSSRVFDAPDALGK